MSPTSGSSRNPWTPFAQDMSGVTLSDPDGSVGPSVRAQSEVVRAVPLDWRDVLTVHCPIGGDAPGPAEVDGVDSPSPAAPVPADLVPLDVVAADPERFGFVEVTGDGTGTGTGPLAGLRYARKDMLFRTGELCECGSPVMAGHRPQATASVLAALDAAGAGDVGRLHMAELAMSPTGRNNWLGPGRNPWDRSRVSGGSSSGSGIAAAARAVDFTIGSDTGGSVRIPAAACGVTGLKPTQGVLALDGVMPLSPSLDCLGILAPAAETVSGVFEVLVRGDGRLPAAAGPADTTVFLPAFGAADELDPVTIDAVRGVADAVHAAGYRVEACAVPELGVLGQLAGMITAVEAASVWGDRLAEDASQFYLEIRRRIERGTLVPAPVYLRALRLRRASLQRFLDEHLPAGGLLLLPTIPTEAPEVAATTEGAPEELEARFARFSFWTRAINYLGLPSVSVPGGFGAHGMPLGVQLVGRPYADRTVLRAAHAVQRQTEWHRRIPNPTR